jgi:hypothetical protein
VERANVVLDDTTSNADTHKNMTNIDMLSSNLHTESNYASRTNKLKAKILGGYQIPIRRIFKLDDSINGPINSKNIT